MYKQNYGLTTRNFYIIRDPYILFWVKKKGEYYPNNPQLRKSGNSRMTDLNKFVNKKTNNK
ncbi:hypothetical protein COSHB9_09550 [Companilactobacillus alimentarius]|uniref:Uncharacterized protein n=1 Tax=Companilactobacillus alimentarius DSM 20249 TaxID=1423720 RepID=A0A2K9HKP6_9LACO|nr:hypothetical protein LA20249_09915 [Companilactobacillus alimentarius DSM 20249]KRK77755.1 hypothetical protein FC67_GL000093 [Companilactobacillus alimentarius DSM 20249]GEO45007.1 hypothetical protein LAL01_12390 [Companilactobacillus alimentarius]